jgi:hypothetical protein
VDLLTLVCYSDFLVTLHSARVILILLLSLAPTPNFPWLTIENGTWERRTGTKVVHGLEEAEMTTMERERRGNLTAG